jgi:hypothetical protein
MAVGTWLLIAPYHFSQFPHRSFSSSAPLLRIIIIPSMTTIWRDQ